MATLVVELLESIHVAHDQRERAAVSDGLRDFLREATVEVGAVPEAGEAVDLRLLRQHLHQVLHAERAAHAGLQLDHLERLGHEVDGAEIERTHAILHACRGGDEDHGNVLEVHVGLECLEHLEAVHALHLDVEEDHVGLQLPRHLEAAHGNHRAMELDLLMLQTDAQEPMDQLRVVDRKDLGK